MKTMRIVSPDTIVEVAAYYVVSAVCAVMSSLLSWLTWGSTGPLTNLGYHDFFGAGFVYLFPAGMAIVPPSTTSTLSFVAAVATPFSTMSSLRDR